MTGAMGAANAARGPLLAANADTAAIQLDPEALLHARNILQAKSEDLLRWLYRARAVKVGLCGSDPISQPAADAFNAKAHPILEQATIFANSLGAAADELLRTARSYGATDEQVKRSFDAFSKRAEVNPVGPAVAGAPFDPLRAGMRQYLPPAQSAPRAPGDLSPLVNPPAPGPANPLPGLGGGYR